jgi:antitoxin HigA-1
MPKKSTAIDLIPNPTPGEILLREFIEPMKLSQNGLARAIGVPPRRI